MLAGLLFATLVLADIHHWSVVLLCQFLAMAAHGINFPCIQSGAIAPFPREAGAAAGLLGFITMIAALVAGTWVGFSHDGSLQPLALTSAVIGVLVFTSARALRHLRQVDA
jgi:DHA1 family bicyclomycin/chloramphenicol resistance-like MFS transporter